MHFKDQLNRNIAIPNPPERIISLVPSITELLVDLGLEKRIVGVTKFCIYPSYLTKEKAVVGGTKTIKPHKISALNPDVILCNKEENSQDIISNLESIAPIHISDIYNLEDVYELIKMYGEIFNIEENSNQLIHRIKKEKQSFKLHTFKTYKVAYFIWKNPWMVTGSDTFINHMLKQSGFENVFKHQKRYPKIDIDNSTLKNAEIIMLSSEPYPFKNEHVEELKKYFPNKVVIKVNGEFFSWYGSRLVLSFKYFKTLHQQIIPITN